MADAFKQELLSSPLPAGSAEITEPFIRDIMETVRTKMLPYQWEALNDRIPDAEPSYCIKNYRIAAGLEFGGHGGCVFQDSDFAKWIEAVGYSLSVHPDPELENTADGAIDLIVQAQQTDGYLDTYYILNGLEQRWTNVMDNHELYCAGHLIEGAVAYYQATGKDKLLKAVCRLADHIGTVFGPGPDQLHGYPGHEEIELALVKLYRATGEKRYLDLAEYFINERGKQPSFFLQEVQNRGGSYHWQDGPLKLRYYQADQPVREQQEAQGHAVRAVYLYSGMADVAKETQDASLLAACERLWKNLTSRRMYITGAIGSSEYGEAFTYDYDLPNGTVYAETCAAIGLVFFARRMLEIRPRGEYGDVMERALYNGVLSGMSLDGTKFFYVNPLEVFPESCEKDYLRRHVKPERQKWFGCACCPPNIARLVSSIASYAVTVNSGSAFVHLFIGGDYCFRAGDTEVCLRMETQYPWEGAVRVRVSVPEPVRFDLWMRSPGWAEKETIRTSWGDSNATVQDGYLLFAREWNDGDEIELQLEMPVELVSANPDVRENAGKAAVMRGPVVYCLEEADNGNDLHRIRLGEDPEFTVSFDTETFHAAVLQSEGFKLSDKNWEDGALYASGRKERWVQTTLKWIPYFCWANRGLGEMTVWVRK